MTDLVLTSEHDLEITNLDLALHTTLEELTKQKLKINLLVYKGEWFLDVNTGVPYLQTILGRRNTQSAADIVIKQAILQTGNIKSIKNYQSIVTKDRKLVINFDAKMISGGSLQNIILGI